MLLTQHASGSAWGYGLFILETLVALGVIAAAGYAVVRISRKQLGLSGKTGRMRLLERLPLEHRRSLHLVEVDDRAYLIGTSENSVQLLTVVEAPGGERRTTEKAERS